MSQQHLSAEASVAKGSRNRALQALRGAAACSVMVYHSAFFTAAKTGATWLGDVFSGRLGYYGVLVFFVLSGYLMEGAVRRYGARTFLLHRIARLYPTYLLVVVFYFFLQSIRLHTWQSMPWLALTLLPLGEMTRPLSVEWTLLYEVFFYGICAIFCIWRGFQLTGLLVWFAIVSIAAFHFNQFGTAMQPTLVQIPFSIWNVGFICGSLAGIANRHIRTVNVATLWLSGLALVLLGELLNSGPQMFLAGPGIACVVLAIARTPASGAAEGLGKRAMFQLGEYSYGLYLAHSLGIQIALQYVSASRLSAPVAIFAGMIGVGLVSGIAAGSMDVMVYRRLKKKIDEWTSRASAPSQSEVAEDFSIRQQSG